jgi:hypothetical protein
VHDHVAVVEQDPTRVGRTLGVERLAVELLEQLVAEVLQDGRRLALAAGGADDEVVGDERDATDVQQEDVAGLFVRGQVDNAAGQTKRLGAVRAGAVARLRSRDVARRFAWQWLAPSGDYTTRDQPKENSAPRPRARACW